MLYRDLLVYFDFLFSSGFFRLFLCYHVFFYIDLVAFSFYLTLKIVKYIYILLIIYIYYDTTKYVLYC